MFSIINLRLCYAIAFTRTSPAKSTLHLNSLFSLAYISCDFFNSKEASLNALHCFINIKHNFHDGFRIVSNISNTIDSVSSGYPNTEKRVENTTRSGVFLTKFEVFE